MIDVITSEKIPIKLWLDNIEDLALEQAKNLANLPFAFKHISIMPDSHVGYGMPIGGVFASKDAISPQMVGVDIGCGMCALRTNIEYIDNESLKKIVENIKELIPVGFNSHSEKQDDRWLPQQNYAPTLPIAFENIQKAKYQVGTLGGGNHFIELQKGSDGYIWIMIHSGSRNLGYQVAKYYSKKAQELNEKWYSNVPKELSFFPKDTDEFHKYYTEMEYCIEFAERNRKLMMFRVEEVISSVIPNVDYSNYINKPHNFASFENHFNSNVIVHRKGTCRAREGELGMIPGSQGASSYIVKGKGEKQSFESCSHGAGRKMGRKQAQRELDLEQEKEKMAHRGNIHSINSEKDLDEAPSAYKDINEVMKNQNDLVDIEIELEPLATIKG